MGHNLPISETVGAGNVFWSSTMRRDQVHDAVSTSTSTPGSSTSTPFAGRMWDANAAAQQFAHRRTVDALELLDLASSTRLASDRICRVTAAVDPTVTSFRRPRHHPRTQARRRRQHPVVRHQMPPWPRDAGPQLGKRLGGNMIIGQVLQVPDQQHRSDAQESGAASTLRSRQAVTDEAQ